MGDTRVNAVPKPRREWVKAFREWIMRCPCAVCFPGSRPTDEHGPFGLGMHDPSDPAHVHGRGAGGDDPGNVLPLCRIHHDKQHTKGWEALGLTRAEAAGLAWRYWTAWRLEPHQDFAF